MKRKHSQKLSLSFNIIVQMPVIGDILNSTNTEMIGLSTDTLFYADVDRQESILIEIMQILKLL